MDCSLPNSSLHGIFQARIPEWLAISFSRGSSRLRDWTHVSCLAGRFFTTESPGKPQRWLVAIFAKLCSTLYDPMDCSLPGSSIHGIPRQECWSGLPLLIRIKNSTPNPLIKPAGSSVPYPSELIFISIEDKFKLIEVFIMSTVDQAFLIFSSTTLHS